ncbi:MAG: lysophospholipid acyltransferase family protein [Myxococcota bacterium]|nr:lysophospholipid acyltransferase family protein [Myxococcota bacterium]
MLKWIGKAFLRIFGFETEGGRPVEKKFVLIAAPHTSNWDLPFLIAMAWAYEIKISWMGKHVLFTPLFGWFFRWLGGIPIHRETRNNRVQEMADEFAQRDELVLVIATEGTRSYTAHWKSGFYHVARLAGVPIVMSYLDFKRKRGGFGPALFPSDDLTADMDQIRAFYSDKTGKRPELFGPIRLKEEM